MKAFLSALEETGVISKAAEAAKVTRKTVWLRRKHYPQFAEDYKDALESGALLLEAEAIRRAQEGVVRMKFNSKTGLPFIDPRTGEPYMEAEYSDQLMCLLLRRHFPEQYREQKPDINVSNTVNNITVLSVEKKKELQSVHQRALEALQNQKRLSPQNANDDFTG